jgi:hypothetical protein
MFEDPDEAISRRGLFIDALPCDLRGLSPETFGGAGRAPGAPAREGPGWDAAIRAAEPELPDDGDPAPVHRYIDRLTNRPMRDDERLRAALEVGVPNREGRGGGRRAHPGDHRGSGTGVIAESAADVVRFASGRRLRRHHQEFAPSPALGPWTGWPAAPVPYASSAPVGEFKCALLAHPVRSD